MPDLLNICYAEKYYIAIKPLSIDRLRVFRLPLSGVFKST